MPDGMTEQERKDYDEAMEACHKEEAEQERKNIDLLETIKQQVSKKYFENIKIELEESEHPSSYRIVNKPIGTPQYEKEGDYTVWVNQSCGIAGDDYSGTVCMELPNGTYFLWDYWM